MSIRMFMTKRFVAWPFVPVMLLVFPIRNHDLNVLFSKKYFDQCNLGEQYEIGRERNKVLRECNKLLGREDF